MFIRGGNGSFISPGREGKKRLGNLSDIRDQLKGKARES